MSLKREHYQELTWWRWARLRLLMGWGRLSGRFQRGLGLEQSKSWQNHMAQEVLPQSDVQCPFCGALGHKGFKSH